MGLHLASSFLLTLFLAIATPKVVLGEDININPPVIYDARSLIINGSRQILFSGSIHYPRTQPEMWPNLIKKAKAGGLNVIQTYVFWNVHEPVEGQFNFAGNADLVRFVKCVHEHGLWVNLRLGPYIAAEWNHGGFPYWLREVANITFRSYNEPFMYHMRRFSEMIINMMKNEKLFYPQGGPIIMSQIENEYGAVQATYREDGARYIQWAAEMAVGLYGQIPWLMCKQPNAPSLVIETCNGRHCADTFHGPNGLDKPILWTENWTAQYRAFGDPPSQRSAEDLAFSVANFFANNGTFVNYYMYYGGTNYGRTASSFVTTRYYDEAPLDEYGLMREPKWGHLRDVHRALRLSKKALFWGQRTSMRINKNVEIVTYEKTGDASMCAAFFINKHTKLPATITFRGLVYYVPSKSISILPDCKTVVFNSQTITAQHSTRNFVPSKKATNFRWESYRERIPTYNDLPIKDIIPRELYQLTKDASDYAWYSTSVNIEHRDLPMRPDIMPVLEVQNNGHAMVAFVNGEHIGFAHGNLDQKKFSLVKAVNLRPGINHITFLCMTMGFQNSGAHMEKRWTGPDSVQIKGLNTRTLDLTETHWGHEIGIMGEKLPLYLEEGARKVQWSPDTGLGTSVTWYKTHFKTPEGKNPVAITMDSMNKGMIWINGNNIGRYWASFLTPHGRPSQTEYHIPREFLKHKKNSLVVFEEVGGNPENITIMTVNRDTICSLISEVNPPSVKTWERKENELRKVLFVEDMKSGARLTCPDDKVIVDVEFASFGDPIGACGMFSVGTCHSPNSMSVVLKHCLGKHSCTIPLDRKAFYLTGNIDNCPDTFKSLAVQVRCGKSSMQ